MSSTAAATSEARRLQFSDLPPELRDLIWEHAAPPPRLFHIRRLSSKPVPNAAPDATPGSPVRRPIFYHPHPPPAITAICRDSRRAVLRLGLFLLPISGPHPDAAVWFAPRTDVLYLDRALRIRDGNPPPGFDRVEIVGIEWRRLFRNGSLPVGEYAAAGGRPFWTTYMAALYAVFPGMRALHYVLPLTRYQGGIPWGREPDGAAELEGRLVALPGRTTIPLESGHASWEVMGAQMRRAVGHEDVEARVRARVGDVYYPPEIEGQWLLRDHLPRTFDSPSIKEFHW